VDPSSILTPTTFIKAQEETEKTGGTDALRNSEGEQPSVRKLPLAKASEEGSVKKKDKARRKKPSQLRGDGGRGGTEPSETDFPTLLDQTASGKKMGEGE